MASFIPAFLISACLTPLVAGVAARIGWQSSAVNRAGHHPPLSGGPTLGLLVFFLAALLGGVEIVQQLRAFWLGFFLILLMGLFDDLFGLRPLSKLLLQGACGGVTLWVLRIEGLVTSGLVGCAVLLLWVVAVCNAVNLLDNMDGLAGGVGAIASGALGLLFFGPDSAERLVLVLAAGALLGFLLHNFSPASVYLGDSGSHAVGFALAVLPIYSTVVRDFEGLAVAALLAILGVPILDTSFVIVRRTLHGRPVYEGGKDHSSHWMHARGLSERAVALFFYGVAALGSLAAFLLLGAVG